MRFAVITKDRMVVGLGGKLAWTSDRAEAAETAGYFGYSARVVNADRFARDPNYRAQEIRKAREAGNSAFPRSPRGPYRAYCGCMARVRFWDGDDVYAAECLKCGATW